MKKKNVVKKKVTLKFKKTKEKLKAKKIPMKLIKESIYNNEYKNKNNVFFLVNIMLCKSDNYLVQLWIMMFTKYHYPQALQDGSTPFH